MKFERYKESKDFWQAECLKECNQSVEELDELYRYLKFTMNDNSAYLWEDRFPVSQAVIVCKIDNCAQIGDVYTPPFYRKKGYATSLVSALTHIILAERSKRLSVLLADAANPTSCAIYRKIGYEEVSVIDEVSLQLRPSSFHTSMASAITNSVVSMFSTSDA